MNSATGHGYQVSISFNRSEPDAYRAALVFLANPGGRSGYWGYSGPGASQSALLPTSVPWQSSLVGAWARCLEVTGYARWPDRAAHGCYLDVSVYEAMPSQGLEHDHSTCAPARTDGRPSSQPMPLVLREHFVGRRTPEGLSLSFADDSNYLEMNVPTDLTLEDLEPGPGSLLAQAVCAIDGELARQRRESRSSCLRIRMLRRPRQGSGKRRQGG